MSDIQQKSFDEVFDGFDRGGSAGDRAGIPSGAGGDGYDEFAGVAVGPQPPAPGGRGRRRRPRWVTVVVVLLAVAVVLGGVAEVGLNYWQGSLDKNIERFGDPFRAIPKAERPAADPVAGDAMNLLLLGSDSRISAGRPQDWQSGAQRTDAIMVLHIPADRKSAQVISIPRDSWVSVPGKGYNKINSGFSFGGPSLMVRTVESLTGVRIDHVVIIDFTGFQKITDALGGVRICVPKRVSDRIGDIGAGCQVMDGETALQYVRQRKTLANGDFDRVRRQQNWIRQVVKKLNSKGTLTNPFTLNSALDALTSATATDNGFTIDLMSDIALSYQGVSASNVQFFTAPLADPPTGTEGAQSVVYLDTAQNTTLWQAVRKDRVNAWIAEHNPRVLGETVR